MFVASNIKGTMLQNHCSHAFKTQGFGHVIIHAGIKTTFPVSFKRDDSELSTMLGLLAAQSDSLSFYANAAQSFSPPSASMA